MLGRLETPVGTLWIEETDGAVTRVTNRPLSGPEGETPVLAQAKRELCEYFAGARKTFTVPLNPAGTDFQRAVWAALAGDPLRRDAHLRRGRRGGRPPEGRAGPSETRTTKTQF